MRLYRSSRVVSAVPSLNSFVKMVLASIGRSFETGRRVVGSRESESHAAERVRSSFSLIPESFSSSETSRVLYQVNVVSIRALLANSDGRSCNPARAHLAAFTHNLALHPPRSFSQSSSLFRRPLILSCGGGPLVALELARFVLLEPTLPPALDEARELLLVLVARSAPGVLGPDEELGHGRGVALKRECAREFLGVHTSEVVTRSLASHLSSTV